jgi:phosphatidylserine/phosphatidylglycerophosphate/cardiolipin synthase-like enzyme
VHRYYPEYMENAQISNTEMMLGEDLLPRSLEVSDKTRACLHAKCVVVDEEYSLVTSANFTEAAHERNIEAGVMLKDKALAKALISQLETLATRKILLPIDFQEQS